MVLQCWKSVCRRKFVWMGHAAVARTTIAMTACYFVSWCVDWDIPAQMSDVSCRSGRPHTHTHLMALCPRLPRWAGTRKVRLIWILLKQETVSGSGISWATMQVCTSLQTDNHASTPPFSSLQAGCPSCCLTNSVKALKEVEHKVAYVILVLVHLCCCCALGTYNSYCQKSTVHCIQVVDWIS